MVSRPQEVDVSLPNSSCVCHCLGPGAAAALRQADPAGRQRLRRLDHLQRDSAVEGALGGLVNDTPSRPGRSCGPRCTRQMSRRVSTPLSRQRRATLCAGFDRIDACCQMERAPSPDRSDFPNQSSNGRFDALPGEHPHQHDDSKDDEADHRSSSADSLTLLSAGRAEPLTPTLGSCPPSQMSLTASLP